MNKFACLYTVVHFAPFVETGEFANVGIVIMAPNERFFGFKLMGRRHSRVTQFFEQLDAKVFRGAMGVLREELERTKSLLKQHGFDKRLKHNDVDFAKRVFAEIVRPRETVIKFSETRAVLVEDVGAKLEELYGHYVERDFVTREYQETVLERGLRKWLWQAQVGERFTRLEVGNEEYHVVFPFVECDRDTPIKAIKPLHLAHPQPSKILDHGGQWLFRVHTLKRKDLLPPNVLFAVSQPEADGPRGKACSEIIGELQEAGVRVLPIVDKAKILDFVTAHH
jgi:hypothetical protein